MHAAALAATFMVWTTAPPVLKPPTAAVPIDIVDISAVSNVSPISADEQPIEPLAPESVQGAPQELAEAIPAPTLKSRARASISTTSPSYWIAPSPLARAIRPLPRAPNPSPASARVSASVQATD
ncbi:MAG: hypothetical protein EBZ50_05275 [Alphaproteobacteria bacterium]|nr:hypothetical protein [Alphaproteobacteria bacterium]